MKDNFNITQSDGVRCCCGGEIVFRKANGCGKPEHFICTRCFRVWLVSEMKKILYGG